MVAPKSNDRAEMLARDGGRCVSCGATTALEAQHRGAVGMGGSKVAPRLDELLTACAPDNAAYEGALQRVALLNGWKVRRWVVEQGIAYRVPVFYAMDRGWYLVDREGVRVPISRSRARGLMVEVYGDEYLEWENAA